MQPEIEHELERLAGLASAARARLAELRELAGQARAMVDDLRRSLTAREGASAEGTPMARQTQGEAQPG